MRKSLIKKISGLICSSVMIKGLGFLFRIYLSKTAGAEGCGLYHLVLSVYTFGAGLASIGMNQTVARLVSKIVPRQKIFGYLAVYRRFRQICLRAALPC